MADPNESIPAEDVAKLILTTAVAVQSEGVETAGSVFARDVQVLSRAHLALLAAVRKHRDQRGDDRCWQDDDELYAALPEGKAGADTRLPPPDEMRACCERYILSRHDSSQPYVSPQREVERLQAKCADLAGYAEHSMRCRTRRFFYAQDEEGQPKTTPEGLCDCGLVEVYAGTQMSDESTRVREALTQIRSNLYARLVARAPLEAGENAARRLADVLHHAMPPGWGFAMGLFTVGDGGMYGGLLTYISDLAPEGMLEAFRGLVKRIEDRTPSL